MKRSQVALEFMIVMGFAIMIIASYLVITMESRQRALDDSAQEEAQRIAQYIQDELLVAAQVRDGYTRTVALPAQIGNRYYTIEQTEDFVIVTHTTAYATRKTPPVLGNFTPGTNTVTKNGGTIFIS